MSESRWRIAVVVTCHNRREKTRACLESIRVQSLGLAVEQELFLTDDGSTDGTAEMVRTVWPGATIVMGDGTLFWNQGMRRAWQAAAATDPDYYWLINDDTVVEPFALADLLALAPGADRRVIAVGAVVDPRNGRQVYGGWRRRGRELVSASGVVEACETMNANCALVPRAVFQEIGMFHEAYSHAMGDFDYGFEAGRHGIAVWQTSRAIARCEGNAVEGTWRDRTLGRAERWKKIQSVKGLPPAEWWVYTWRNEGWLAPLRFVSPYLKVWRGR